MASAQDRKRARADDLSQEHRPNKKIKSRGRLHGPSNFPPEFWDNLSKVWLTRRALRELDRRNSTRPAPGPAAPAVHTTDHARFARHGGPDLRHLRGYPEPKSAVPAMASSRSTVSSSQQTKATTVPKTKTSSAYDDDFEQHMIDNGIYPEGHEYPAGRVTPEPENVDELRLELLAARASLSPSQFPDSTLRNFRKKNKTPSEGTVMRNVIPIIAGDSDIPNEGNLPFTNIKSMTGGATVEAVPDFFDGAPSGDIDKAVRDDLSQMIIPTKHANVPIVPNLFLEVNAQGGGADVALHQALHGGAIGARAMHALQNYGAEEPAFDGNAYTYSSTYHAGSGVLLLGFAMTDTREAFVQGATAFRNARDLAQRYRDNFIRAANARASQPGTAAAQENLDYAAPGDVEDEPALPHYLEDDEPSQESTFFGAEPAMSFATSFTSSFTAQGQTSSKRNRDSPPSKPRLDVLRIYCTSAGLG
ncbi:hypothetical protein F5883DRAFT_631949 [Diaporthe sp. PMI_573]|nr:hypothetical protein F5883DRAFT_631949 [Diaporthaceae sp. PMI_573]